MQTNAIVKGSLTDVAQREGASLAETFLNCDLITLVDTSGSMEARDGRGQRQRYEVACEELATLQGKHPGKIGVIAFSDNAMFCPAGVPTFFKGGTDVAKALQYAKIADVQGITFVVISDGHPDDAEAALKIARTYTVRIDAIYVGPEDNPRGREFLQKLTAASGGRTLTTDRAAELAASVETLMLGA